MTINHLRLFLFFKYSVHHIHSYRNKLLPWLWSSKQRVRRCTPRNSGNTTGFVFSKYVDYNSIPRRLWGDRNVICLWPDTV